jgi:hypothetical protein
MLKSSPPSIFIITIVSLLLLLLEVVAEGLLLGDTYAIFDCLLCLK